MPPPDSHQDDSGDSSRRFFAQSDAHDNVVLLIERSRAMRDLMTSVLRREYQTQTVVTYEEALQRAQAEQYDGIVLSVYPGDVNRGTSVIEQIRAISSHDDVPIVVVGGPFLERDCAFLVEEGGDEVLQRPFAQSDLLDVMAGTIQNN